MKATLKLFKCLPVKTKQKKSPTKELLQKTIKRGFVFAPEIIANYQNYDELINLVEEVYGITAEKVNTSFHKSWRKVKDADIEQLITEQIAHYLTTYGKKDPIGYLLQKEFIENWGVDNLSEKILTLDDFDANEIYDKDYVYIPKELLSIPKAEEIKLVIIKGLTKKELKEKLLKLLNSGIALKEDTIQDVIDVALFVGIDGKDIEVVKNKEVKCILYEYLNMLPENPVEFLRFIIYSATDSTLIIKSKELIAKIKEKKNVKIIKYFRDYDKKYGYEKLASIFLRFKPLWLSFRQNREMKTIINRLRKLAIRHHRPMREDYLNEVTAKIKKGIAIDKEKLESELKRVNIFRKIRLGYSLQYRLKNIESIIYRIRNGKAYATLNEKYNMKQKDEAKKILDVVLDSIVNDIKPNVKGKKIYIPDYIHYALPCTEKQFTGNMPAGTYISVKTDMIVGVHWENVRDNPYNQIDLDLSLISPKAGKIGWDSYYRTEDRGILFSGDITDAPKPKGATELFYVKRQLKDEYIFFLNYYNYDKEIKVPFKIIIAKEKAKDFEENYMVNPNNIVSVVQSEIDKRQKILGLLITTTKESRFYFVETSIGMSITSTNSEVAENARKYLIGFYQNSIELKDILERAGAIVTWDYKICDSEIQDVIDLSPENLEKNSILDLLIKK